MRAPVLLIALVLPACIAEDRLDDEWVLIAEGLAEQDLAVVATLPEDGVIGVGRRGRPYVIFNRPMTDEEAASVGDMTILDLRRDITQTAPAEIEFDAVAAWFDLDQLTRNLDYELSVEAPLEARDELVVDVATDVPRGPAFHLTSESETLIETFGGEAADAASINNFFTDMHPLWVLRAEGLGALPGTIDVGLAPGDRGETFDVTQAWGYATWFRGVEVDADGGFEHTQRRVIVPLYIGGDAHGAALAHLDDPVLSGRFVFDAEGAPTGIEDFRVAGVIGTRWLRRMAQGERPWSDVVRLANPDVDTNDNGVPDALSFAIRSQPIAIGDPGLIED